MTALAIPTLDLPWTPDPVAERRFRRTLGRIALAALLFGLLVPWLPLPQRDASVPTEVPERYARLLIERVPPPPARIAEQPAPQQPAPAVEQPAAAPAQTRRPQPVAVPAPVPSARERAAATGVMAFAETLADLRADEAVAAATTERLSASAGEAQRNERNIITARGGGDSGGISTAALSRDTGGAGLGAREATRVASPVGGMAAGSGGSGAPAGEGPGARSREEIELVFDRNKAAIYALYNRALRNDSTLRGRLVLELTIAPSGEVTHARVVTSELSDPEFERRLVSRVMLFRFEARDVATVTTTKPIEFFPS